MKKDSDAAKIGRNDQLRSRRRRRAAGVPRERILVLLAEDPTLDARNPRRGQVFLHANGDQSEKDDVALDGGADGAFEEFADADYVGDEVTPELVRAVLSGRHDPRTPRSKRLESTDTSNVFVYVRPRGSSFDESRRRRGDDVDVPRRTSPRRRRGNSIRDRLRYLTGHGGDEFLKFHDADELSANEVADALAEMRAKRRYGRLVLMVDTCQAGSLFNYLDAKTTPRVLGIASAKVGENAYARRRRRRSRRPRSTSLARRDADRPRTRRGDAAAATWIFHPESRGIGFGAGVVGRNAGVVLPIDAAAPRRRRGVADDRAPAAGGPAGPTRLPRNIRARRRASTE